MNAVEIEEAVSKLAEMPFDAESFPYAFLEAFGNKATTIQKLRSGASNKSDVSGGVLQRNHIHIAVAETGKVGEVMNQLRTSKATSVQKAKFILSTDGVDFQAEDLSSDDPPVVCTYKDFPNHFGFFLALAGISTVKQIRESSFDIKATGRLNRLYLELLKDNPKWGTAEKRHDMNHFMARLIFCFFAEDTGIFNRKGLFSTTVEQMSERDSSNTHEVISEIFRSMNTEFKVRSDANLPRWVNEFPYVNGGLFSGNTEVPRFSKIARSYLLHIGNLEWSKINPDIFGSMIQAVAEDEERGLLGMHYTSVPNILRLLNPLFLDDLRTQLEKAGNNSRMLLNLRKRISNIRVFDPACGSGNFLVIAYKELRAIEYEINKRRNEFHERTVIDLTNFRGIELRDFPAEIARLALIIAEYQCNVTYIGQMDALLEFLPLDANNWIVCGNALSVDWAQVCMSKDNVDGSETYICGNPPYKGNADQSKEQKKDMQNCFEKSSVNWKSLDYICGWFWKAMKLTVLTNARFAFVSTNSISQGQSISYFWKPLLESGLKIDFAVRSFKWKNLATENAAVTVVIIGCSRLQDRQCILFDDDVMIKADHINAYLVPGRSVFVERSSKPISEVPQMIKGNYYGLSEGLLLNNEQRIEILNSGVPERYIKKFKGAADLTRGNLRWCLWFPDAEVPIDIMKNPLIKERIDSVRKSRLVSPDSAATKMAKFPHQFREMNSCENWTIAIPTVSSEFRAYLPVTLENYDVVFPNAAFCLFDAGLHCLSIVASKLHLIWIATVCGKLKTDFRYSNTLGWNTFPIPKLTERNIADLAACAQEIILAREAHFPASIADLYAPDAMPDNLRLAHERNDEVLERIYIGRRFKNDSERLEKLFELYTKMSPTIVLESKSKSKHNTKKKDVQV